MSAPITTGSCSNESQKSNDAAITNTTDTTNSTATTDTMLRINGVTLSRFTNDPRTWKHSHLVTVQQMTTSGLQLLLQTSQQMMMLILKQQQDKSKSRSKRNRKKHATDADDIDEYDVLHALEDCVIGTIFYEASTRTSCSFQASTLRLKGSYIHIDGSSGSNNTSSIKKGETLADTIRCIQCYTDAIVLRHPTTGSIYTILQQQQQSSSAGRIAADSSSTTTTNNRRRQSPKPIINAGDGIGEHPTQALLDVYTIYMEFIVHRCQTIIPDTLIIVVLGDLKHGRTVHSLIQLLISTTRNILYANQLIIRCCAPNASLQLPSDLILVPPQSQQTSEGNTTGDTTTTNSNLNNNANGSIRMEFYTDPLLACTNANVLYVTRIQRERFDNDTDYNAVKGSYVINMQFLNSVSSLSSSSSSEMIVLHPLPRVDEISTDIDHDPRAVYFQQMEYGMYVRMAILYLILNPTAVVKVSTEQQEQETHVEESME